ncbi:MAG: hypothetical protein DI543_01360 [Bradyrhizobium icense]|nr:MAG: hypothetical protein DI543_01360 [Bradyrhizobium icense]
MQAYPPLRPRPSLGRRMFRRVFRFAIVLLLGIGATLGWQAYGDTGKQMFASYVPDYAWLLSYLPGTKPPAPVAITAASSNPALQLEPLAANLAASIEYVRRSVEQLALKQEQLARNITALQAVDEDIRQKISAPSLAAAPAPAQPMAAIPQPKPATPKPQAAAGAPGPRPAGASGPLPIAPQR